MFDSDRLKRFATQKALDWPDLLRTIDLSSGETPSIVWDYPRIACQATRGTREMWSWLYSSLSARTIASGFVFASERAT